MKETRRKFLKKSAALSAISIIPSHLLFSKPAVKDSEGNIVKQASFVPSDKVNVAFCGIGNRGGAILQALHGTGQVNVAALCDVDFGADYVQKTLKDKNFASVKKRFNDFRVMFDKIGNEFDAVCAGTPDFSHFPICIQSMAEGKHVYVEKPLTRTFYEAELLIQAEKKFKVVTQMGNQGHSGQNYHQFKAWTEAGIIKDVTKIVAHMNKGRRWHGFDMNMKTFPKTTPMPESLDWDTWLMASEYHEYAEKFVDGDWRCWYDFGMGALGDWGAHIMDTSHRFLNLGLPYEVDPVKIDGHNPLFFPQASTLNFKFPKRGDMPPVVIEWYDGVDNIPPVPAGYGDGAVADPDIPPTTDGITTPAKLNPGKIIYGKDLTFKGGTHTSTLSIIPEDKAKDMESKLPKVPIGRIDHFSNFVRACKGEEKARSSFDISGPLSQVFCLGVIAQRLNTKIEFDRKTKRITNNEFANALLAGTPPRKGWEDYYKL